MKSLIKVIVITTIFGTPKLTVDVPPSMIAEAVRKPVTTKYEAGIDWIYDGDWYAPIETVEEPITEAYEEPVYAVEETTAEVESLVLFGTYTVTFYCPCSECCNGNIGALGVELTPWYSIALPDYSYLGRTFYVDGFGYFRCEDVSPAGICDIFVSHHSEIPSYGMTTAYLWEVVG